MAAKDWAALEHLFLGLADKTRLRLLALIGNGEISVGSLVEQLGESQPKVSRHLAYLRNARLVATRRDGKLMYYSVAPQEDEATGRLLSAVVHSLRMDAPTAANPRHRAVEPMQEARSDQTEKEPVDQTPDEPGEMEVFLL